MFWGDLLIYVERAKIVGILFDIKGMMNFKNGEKSHLFSLSHFTKITRGRTVSGQHS